MNDTGNDLELTPVCDPPLRATPGVPIGGSWWIEPSHPEIDPATSLAPGAASPGKPADES